MALIGGLPEVVHVGFVLGHGGDARMMLELAASLQEHGQPSRMIVPENQASVALARDGEDRGVSVERSKLLHVNGSDARQSVLELIKLLLPLRGSLIHFHTGDTCLPRRALIAAGLLQLPRAIVTIHGSHRTMQPGDLRSRQWAFAANRLLWGVVCPSVHSREFQGQIGVAPGMAVTVPNGVNLERFATGNRAVIRTRLNLAPDDPLVVFTSRLEPEKRPGDALEAVRRISGGHPGAHLAFVGCGTLDQELRESAQKLGLADRVHFAGFQMNIEDWLAASDVWLLPTEGENFSVAVLEAMAAGCAILSTECSGNNEVLVDNENALLADPGDVNALAANLERLLQSPDERRRLAARAKRDSEAYSVDRMASAYMRLYGKLNETARIPLFRTA